MDVSNINSGTFGKAKPFQRNKNYKIGQKLGWTSDKYKLKITNDGKLTN